jgi:ABC-type Fe3+-siderophore transport system permease subunit
MRSDAAAGVFVAALVLGLISLHEGWTPLAAVCGAVMVGVIVATARGRRSGDEPEVTIRPGDERAWRRPKDDE